jgi:hypothetical protein
MDLKKLAVGQKVWSDYELRWVRMGQQFDGTDPITDTSKLVVGQDVWVSAVDQGFIEGKVVKVTPEVADVQATGQGIIHFNREGYLPFHTIHDLPYWRIDSLPVAEHRALLEWGRQKTMAVGQKNQKVRTMAVAVGQKVWMQRGDEFWAGTVEEVTEYYVRVALYNENFGYRVHFRGVHNGSNGYTDFNRYHGAIDFRYDGSQCGLWEWVDGWDPRPLGTWRLTDNHSAAEAFTREREAFVERYCQEHGFTKETMTKKQVLEMREEEGWKNPR